MGPMGPMGPLGPMVPMGPLGLMGPMAQPEGLINQPEGLLSNFEYIQIMMSANKYRRKHNDICFGAHASHASLLRPPPPPSNSIFTATCTRKEGFQGKKDPRVKRQNQKDYVSKLYRDSFIIRLTCNWVHFGGWHPPKPPQRAGGIAPQTPCRRATVSRRSLVSRQQISPASFLAPRTNPQWASVISRCALTQLET